MTKTALLDVLRHLPHDCEILAYDSETGMDTPVTGAIYHPLDNTLTLLTDED
jgi:hypothetical protein